MQYITKAKDYMYSGVLANHLESFVAEKRGTGCVYETEAKNLSSFSRFTLNFDIPVNTLPKEVVQAWLLRRTDETDKTIHSRYSLIRLFAKYMVRMGYDAYIPTVEDIGKLRLGYVPYIFSREEILAMFSVIDSFHYKAKSCSPRRHIIMPIFFRLLYCCGLRVSEAAHLQIKDVDLENGVLTIRDSKFGKCRYVPMSTEITQRCVEYSKTLSKTADISDWFFQAPDGGCYGDKAIYCVFRDVLWAAGISHGGRGKGPRLHDLRHTFAVHCLQNWVANGMDTTTILPRLSAYMGHGSFAATERYLRLTAEIYPQISAQLQAKYGYVIPTVKGDSEE